MRIHPTELASANKLAPAELVRIFPESPFIRQALHQEDPGAPWRGKGELKYSSVDLSADCRCLTGQALPPASSAALPTMGGKK